MLGLPLDLVADRDEVDDRGFLAACALDLKRFLFTAFPDLKIFLKKAQQLYFSSMRDGSETSISGIIMNLDCTSSDVMRTNKKTPFVVLDPGKILRATNVVWIQSSRFSSDKYPLGYGVTHLRSVHGESFLVSSRHLRNEREHLLISVVRPEAVSVDQIGRTEA